MTHTPPTGAKLTARTGLWSSPSTWADGKVPPDDSPIYIRPGHNVTLNQNATTCGILNEGGLIFDRSKAVTLDNCENIVSPGRLRLGYGSYKHTVHFHEIDESKFQGGGDMVIDTDTGLWFPDGGIADWKGVNKTTWTLAETMYAGTRTLRVLDATGWKTGDVLVVMPTRVKDYTGTETIQIKSVSGKVISLIDQVKNDHPGPVEVVNISQSVLITGEPGARGHVHFCMNKVTQTVNNVAIQFMGMPLTGRYGLHQHKCGNTGSTWNNVVITDSGNDSFVTHETHGSTFNNCVSLRTARDGFGWDPGTLSDRTTYNRCLAAMAGRIGFMLMGGTGNKITNCTAVGCQLIEYPSAANQMPNVWEDHHNTGHNIPGIGGRSWQNDPGKHNPQNLTFYNCPTGWMSGAYTQNYQNDRIICIGGNIEAWALPRPKGPKDQWGYGQHFLECEADNFIIRRHTLPGEGAILVKDCKFHEVVINNDGNIPGSYDFVNCIILPTIINLCPGSVVRCQDGGKAVRWDNGWKEIELFFSDRQLSVGE